jgi:hypothetical protein
MHWTYGHSDNTSRIRRAYLQGDYGTVAYVERRLDGSWHWQVLRYSTVMGIEPTRQMAMDAAEAAWQQHSEWGT